MQQGLVPELQSALLFESPEEVYLRIFRELKPRTKPPAIRVEYRKLANADSSVRLENDLLLVRISDVLEGAPAPVKESLAYILMGKLYRKPVARAYFQRYRLYLNRKEVRRQLQLVRQLRGRKYISGPAGKYYDLSSIFDDLNQQYFSGSLSKPRLGWSLHCSRTLLGHFDPCHNAIIISRIFDDLEVPRIALDYVMFHEMLHIQYPVDHSRTRRCVHTREFREAEKKFLSFTEAREALKKL